MNEQVNPCNASIDGEHGVATEHRQVLDPNPKAEELTPEPLCGRPYWIYSVSDVLSVASAQELVVRRCS